MIKCVNCGKYDKTVKLCYAGANAKSKKCLECVGKFLCPNCIKKCLEIKRRKWAGRLKKRRD